MRLSRHLFVIDIMCALVLFKWIIALADSLTTLAALNDKIVARQVRIFFSQRHDLTIFWVDIGRIRQTKVTGALLYVMADGAVLLD